MRWNGNRTASYEKFAFRAIFCYLLCLALVAGYSALKAHRSEIDDYDFAPKVNFDYRDRVVILRSESMCRDWFAVNAEGQKLCYIPAIEDIFYLIFSETATEAESKAIKRVLDYTYYGDMNYEPDNAFDLDPGVKVPFSETIITRTIPMPDQEFIPEPEEGMTYEERRKQLKELQYKHLSPSSCQTLFESEEGGDYDNIIVFGFSGTLVFHSDNSVELYGDTRDITVCFWTQEAMWTVSGSGGLYAKIAVVDGEIKVEGLTSYEVEREKSIFT